MNNITTAAQSAVRTTLADQAQPAEADSNEKMKKGNREIVTDFYVSNDIFGEKFKFRMFVRLNAKNKKFTKVSFEHCIFEGCYFNTCVFDSCDFTGCKFIGSNLHLSAFNL